MTKDNPEGSVFGPPNYTPEYMAGILRDPLTQYLRGEERRSHQTRTESSMLRQATGIELPANLSLEGLITVLHVLALKAQAEMAAYDDRYAQHDAVILGRAEAVSP